MTYVTMRQESRDKFTNIEKMILGRVDHNKNFLGVFIGETGSGKSYGALRLAERLDPTFNASRICFEQNEFVSLLRHGDLKKGNVVMWDEVGVGHNSKSWFSKFNKVINHVLQVFRRRNLIVIFTTPDFNFIDSDARKLLHGYFKTRHIDFDKKILYATFYELQNNPFYGKLYHKRIWGQNARNGLGRINNTGFGMPSAELVKEYERVKKAFDDKKLEDADLDAQAEAIEAKKNTPPEHYLKVYNIYKEHFNFTKVEEITGIPKQTCSKFVRDLVNNYGYEYPMKNGEI